MLYLYNTLTKQKDPFIPIHKRTVGLYTCGPTVYNNAHIGNLRTYIFEDILKKVLLYNGYKVKHVMNITDVGHLTSDTDEGEDKIELRANQIKKSTWEIAKFYTNEFRHDLKLLNIKEPTIWSKATDHIKEQIELIKKLEKRGYTYTTSDGIYFDTSKFPKYGEMARLKKQRLKAGARVMFNLEKKSLYDFALWKFSPFNSKRQMEWKSPWGKGFPGWHIECSAMAVKYLGKHFDIHCGGIDHIAIHHTNEIAQIEAITNRRWVNFWLHSNFLNLSTTKMSKSTKNFITLKKLVDDGYQPLAFRYLCLTASYRDPLVFSLKSLEAAQGGYNTLRGLVANLLKHKTSKKNLTATENIKEDFLKVINNDLNTSEALAIVWKLLKNNEIDNDEKYKLLLDFDKVLGLDLKNVRPFPPIPSNIKRLVEKREQLRKAKNYGQADKIREELRLLGFKIIDTHNGAFAEKLDNHN